MPIIGLILGTATLVVVHSVMKGFAVNLEAIVKGLTLDVVVYRSDLAMFKYDEVKGELKNISNIDFVVPSIEMDGIIKIGESAKPVKLWAVSINNLPKGWQQYFHPIRQLEKSKKLTAFMGCYIFDEIDTKKKAKFLSLLPSNITLPIELDIEIIGNFCTDLYEYDNFYMIVDLYNFQKSLGLTTINKVYIQLKNQHRLRDTGEEIRAKLPKKFYVSSWTYQKKSLLTAVEVERNITQIIIMLILVTTGFGFGSILYILVVNKTKEIGYLKSLGINNINIFLLFIIISLFVSVCGSLLGCGLGYLFAKNINEIAQFLEKYTGFKLFPPQEYLFYSIPYYWSWKWVIFVSLLNIGILVFAALLPAYKAAYLNPAYILKNE